MNGWKPYTTVVVNSVVLAGEIYSNLSKAMKDFPADCGLDVENLFVSRGLEHNEVLPKASQGCVRVPYRIESYGDQKTKMIDKVLESAL